MGVLVRNRLQFVNRVSRELDRIVVLHTFSCLSFVQSIEFVDVFSFISNVINETRVQLNLISLVFFLTQTFKAPLLTPGDIM